ncbi:hypothetical protein [Streptomyces sp. NPDC001492]
MSDRQTADETARNDELADRRAFLLRMDGPPVEDEAQGLRLLAEIEAADHASTVALSTGGTVDSQDVAAQALRRAYAWARLAKLNPEFDEAADAALRTWDAAEEAHTVAVVQAVRR